jgi:hypothetical protein
VRTQIVIAISSDTAASDDSDLDHIRKQRLLPDQVCTHFLHMYISALHIFRSWVMGRVSRGFSEFYGELPLALP